MNGYWFKSTSFAVEPGEDEEANPGIYGRQLARWLGSKLKERGYKDVDVFPEDWGWCVMCHYQPFMLWIGCGNMQDGDPSSMASPPAKDSVIWHLFLVAEVPFWKRIFRRVDTTPDLARLNGQVQEILSSEKGIKLLEEP